MEKIKPVRIVVKDYENNSTDVGTRILEVHRGINDRAKRWKRSQAEFNAWAGGMMKGVMNEIVKTLEVVEVPK